MQAREIHERILHIVTNISKKYRRPNFIPSVEEFLKIINVEIPMSKELLELSQLINPKDIQETVKWAAKYAYFEFIRSQVGIRTFEVRKDLALMLCETDLPDYSCEYLALPFEYIKIVVQPNTFSSPFKKVQNVSVVRAQDDPISVFFWLDSYYMNFTLDTNEKNGSIKDAVEYEKQKYKLSEAFPGQMKQALGIETLYTTDILTFVVNVLLYISDPTADKTFSPKTQMLHQKLQGVKQKSKRSALEKQLKESKSIYILGANTRISPELTAPLTENGRKLTKRFRVRGHYRVLQAEIYKVKRSTWVKPHWKGPTFAQLLEKGYIVK